VRSNLETTRQLFDVLASEDVIVRMNDERLQAEGIQALRSAAALDFTFALVAPPELGISAEFEGLGGFAEGWNDWLSAFDSYRIEQGELHEAGEVVLATAHMVATPRGSNAAIETDSAAVLRFRDGKVERMEFHLDSAGAFASAGIEPPAR
jgi:ketosteroid isomerase-like protein